MLLLERKRAVKTSMRREIYLSRMEQLGWTEYRLVQEIVKLRQSRGEKATVTGIQSSINKALKDPEGRVTYINDDIVQALNGEFVIRWKNVEEVKL